MGARHRRLIVPPEAGTLFDALRAESRGDARPILAWQTLGRVQLATALLRAGWRGLEIEETCLHVEAEAVKAVSRGRVIRDPCAWIATVCERYGPELTMGPQLPAGVAEGVAAETDPLALVDSEEEARHIRGRIETALAVLPPVLAETVRRRVLLRRPYPDVVAWVPVACRRGPR